MTNPRFSPRKDRKYWYAIQVSGLTQNFIDEIYVDRIDAERDIRFRKKAGSPYEYKIIPVEPQRALKGGMRPQSPREAVDIWKKLGSV